MQPYRQNPALLSLLFSREVSIAYCVLSELDCWVHCFAKIQLLRETILNNISSLSRPFSSTTTGSQSDTASYFLLISDHRTDTDCYLQLNGSDLTVVSTFSLLHSIIVFSPPYWWICNASLHGASFAITLQSDHHTKFNPSYTSYRQHNHVFSRFIDIAPIDWYFA
jgi:hypothetical protein